MANESSQTTETESAPIPAKKNILSLLRSWPLQRQLALGAVLLISLVAFAAIIIQSRTVDQQLLYANLTAADAAAVTDWLKGQKTPYTLKDGGKSIWIPADSIYQSRLDLAANGLPSGGGIGFEVFDKQSFALTNYVQKVNYTRALQGELTRTINSLAPVESTRIHLAIPEKRLFKEQQKNATASVILTLHLGQRLSQEQVEGIAYLVAGSVAGLETENVKVINSNGVVLSQNPGNQARELSTDMLLFQREIEQQMQTRAQDLLNKTMGKERALVRVTATVDFAKVEKTEEFFDGDDPVIRSEQSSNETNIGASDGGVPGVESNLQGRGNNAGKSAPRAVKNQRTTNYEISKTVSHTVNPVGSVEKLSVSVLVADKVKKDPETGELVATPRSATELKSIENMVASAIGIVADRGDVITVVSMPFVEKINEQPQQALNTMEMIQTGLPLLKYGFILIALFLIYFIFLRPLLKTVQGEVLQHNKTVEEMEQEALQNKRKRENAPPPIPSVDVALAKIRKEVMSEHAPTAFIVKNWIHEG